MTVPPFVTRYRAECLLCGILLLSAFLNLWNIWNQGFSNTFYAAAVRSMLDNPHLFFFNSFDPAGFVTVDKPPVGLWVQVAFAAVLGFSGWALVLPQALAGVGSVFLVYVIVSRPFGKAAGLAGAFALAVTPIFVAVSRNGTMDAQLIFVILLALWAALKATRERSLLWLLLSVVLVGIGFNIKMIQAFIVVPAILAIYLLGAELPVKKRIVHLILAIAVLLAVSLSWAVAVDMIPANERPYIGGSGDNTVLGLIVNYNGLHRLENGGMGSMSGGGAGFSSAPYGDMTGPQGAAPSGMPGTQGTDTGMPSSDRRMSSGDMTPPGQGTGQGTGSGRQSGGAPGGGGMGGDTGSPGVLRLAGEGLAGQLSWLIPFSLIGLLAWWRRPATLTVDGFKEAGCFSERGLCLLALALWLVPGLCYFSFTTGFWHPYYLATIAPPLAALVGIGAVAMYHSYRDDGGWKGWLLVAAVAATGIFEVIILNYTPEWSGWLTVLVVNGTITTVLLLAAFRLRHHPCTRLFPRIVAIGAIALLFVAPFVWACTPLASSGNILPSAGPQQVRGGGMSGQANGAGPAGMTGTVSTATAPQGMPGMGTGDQKLEEYLSAHFKNETWAVAVPSSMNGAQIIIDTGMPVMALGGFAGSDEILTVDGAKSLIHDGKVRYFLTSSSITGGGMGGSSNSEIYSWVSSHCTAVSASEWGGTNGTMSNRTGTVSSGMGTSLFSSGSPDSQDYGMGMIPSFAAGNLTMPGNMGSRDAMTGSDLSFAQGNRSLSGSMGSGSGMTGPMGGMEDTLYDCAGSA
jgi:4-amino-4-deoxy-L-arabinose transferase-like glycosyltransferase